MVIQAVELMLDRYDRRISDRYKLIEFREEDNQREVEALSDYFLNVTIPVMCGESGLFCLLAMICEIRYMPCY